MQSRLRSGDDAIESAIIMPFPDIMFITPLGKPAYYMAIASLRVVSGVVSDALMRTQFPHARAGARFHWISSRGKLLAAIIPTTPRGSLLV